MSVLDTTFSFFMTTPTGYMYATLTGTEQNSKLPAGVATASVIPQPTEWQRIGNQIDAAMIFARTDFVKVRSFDIVNTCGHCRTPPRYGSRPSDTTALLTGEIWWQYRAKSIDVVSRRRRGRPGSSNGLARSGSLI